MENRGPYKTIPLPLNDLGWNILLVNKKSDRLEHREGKNTTVWETVQRPNEKGFIDRHNMYVDLSYFEDRIIEEVEKNHPLDLQRIVENWLVNQTKQSLILSYKICILNMLNNR